MNHQAAANGACNVLEMLFCDRYCVNPDELAPRAGFIGAVSDRISPLHVCATATLQTVEKQRETATLLLNAAADPLLVSSRNRFNALHCAALASNQTVGLVLLNACGQDQANVLCNSYAANGVTPVHVAAHVGCADLLLSIIGAGGDVSLKCVKGPFEGKSALDLARANGHQACISMLVMLESNKQCISTET